MKVSYSKPHLTYQEQLQKLIDLGMISWTHRLLALLAEYPTIQPRNMGFPADWHSHPIWSQA